MHAAQAPTPPSAPAASDAASRAAGLPRGRAITSWLMQIIAAAILAQTLFFKFTGAEESIYIFTRLGMEPWGRLASGVAELLACLLLLVPRTAALGATLALGVISGAIVSHLTHLGIVVKDDGGLLFGLALITFACGGSVLMIRRRQLMNLIRGIAVRHTPAMAAPRT